MLKRYFTSFVCDIYALYWIFSLYKLYLPLFGELHYNPFLMSYITKPCIYIFPCFVSYFINPCIYIYLCLVSYIINPCMFIYSCFVGYLLCIDYTVYSRVNVHSSIIYPGVEDIFPCWWNILKIIEIFTPVVWPKSSPLGNSEIIIF